MSNPIHKISLASIEHYGSRVPPAALSGILAAVPELTGQAVRMAFQNSSSLSGRRPSWLQRANDVRLLEIGGRDNTDLYFEAPVFGEAAEELYAQSELWDQRPSPTATPFDLLGNVVQDVLDKNFESGRFDRKLLQSLTRLRRGFAGGFQQATIFSHNEPEHSIAVLNRELAEDACGLYTATPAPKQSRITGVLDMIRASTKTFALKLDTGDSVSGTYFSGEMDLLKQLFEQRVTVLGKANFRPSGHVLRIDADEILPADETDTFFSRLPEPNVKSPALKREFSITPLGKRNVAAIFGKWPGDETDEEIEEALRQIS